MISFDQYQRYATIGNIVGLIQQEYKTEKLKILEVGSNAQRNLEKFVKADIYYTDIIEMDGFADDDHFFIADATNLEGIKDDAYDIVIASDVFEHIPSNLRKSFLSELNRVSKECAIICFPFASDSIHETEERVNQYYKSIYGEDYIWLQEHIENGLPYLEKVNTFLDQKGIYYSTCQHGSIKIWEEMMKAHFYATGSSELIDYRIYIDQFYSKYVYKYDIDKENYRIFYILSKNIYNKQIIDLGLSKLFLQNDKFTTDKYEQIKNLCRDLHNVSLAKIQSDHKRKPSYPPASFYYNIGMGYSEDDKEEKNSVSLDQENVYIIDSIKDRGIKEVRFDFIEQYLCEVTNLSISSDIGEIQHFDTNGLRFENSLLFNTRDPQIVIGIPKNTDKIVISFYISVMSNVTQEKMFIQKYKQYEKLVNKTKELEEKCEQLSHNFSQLQNNYNEIQNNYNETLNNYNEIQNSFNLIVSSRFWRMTKPLRLLANALKKIGIVRYTGKTVLYWKRNGFRKTTIRIKQKLIKENTNSCSFHKKFNIEHVEETILFSIVIPLYNTDINCLKQLLDSIVNQTYSKWELHLGDASTENTDAIKDLCMEYKSRDHRINYFSIKQNKGIAENTNECIKNAVGEYIVLCDHDDILATNALLANAWMIQQTNADVLYSDEDHLDSKGNHTTPLYKPDWSPNLLHSQMYTCHLFVFRKTLLEQTGGFNSEYDGSQDYDLMLRFSEHTNKIVHIPMILYSWREIETSTAANAMAKPYANDAGKRALDAHLKRVYGESAYAINREFPFLYEAHYGFLEKQKPLVSIIIPMKDQIELTKQCINSIIENTIYTNYEIIILNNQSVEDKTYQWLNDLKQSYAKIKVLNADFKFNWSKLNNFGIENSEGDIYIFLNNDTVVISEDWLNKLCDLALCPDIGVVGPMLLYEDGTIQHAGIVVGMGGWADHLYKGMLPEHYASPYISSVVTRNVMAVTGACMAISAKTIRKIGLFDEDFIICGSDVEMCIRAYNHGLNNVYHAGVRLYHLESKSRDSYIPEIDFKKSYESYSMCREYGDPYYNINLDINSVQPKEDDSVNWEKIKAHLKTNRFTSNFYEDIKKKIMLPSAEQQATIPEIQQIKARRIDLSENKIRINLMIPSLDEKHVFGGISTALSFYTKLTQELNCIKRIIVMDAPVIKDSMIDLPDYCVVDASDDVFENNQIVPMADRANKTLPVAEKDIFIATGWWTAYTIADVIHWQKREYSNNKTNIPLIYLIQDYEPGFYPWSSRYLMADSTYKLDIPTIAVINSLELKKYLEQNSYHFYQSFVFEPVLNIELKKYLVQFAKENRSRKKQILVYGRPGVERNAFALVVDSLKYFVQIRDDINEWELISAGEPFSDIDLGKQKILHSIGKVSLAEYAEIMSKTKVAVSLMVSPHPSYPPLEMSSFGIKVITNTYANKNLGDFNENIVSLSNCSAEMIANKISKLCDEPDGTYQINSDYVQNADSEQLTNIAKNIKNIIHNL